MMTKRNTPLCATAAIAAALALTPSVALAQAIEVPDIAVPTTPPPALPETSAPVTPAPVMTSDPVVQTVPEPETPAAATPTPVRAEAAPAVATRTATAPNRAAAVTPRTPVPTPPEPVAETVEPAAPVAAIPAPVEADAVPVTTAEPVDPASTDNTTLLGIVLGGIVVLMLAIWGFVAIGRRKPADRRAAKVIKPVPQHAAAPEPVMAATPAVAEPMPVPATPIRQPAPAASLSHTGASIALPRAMPASFEERDALINRMVAAKPDRANPFTSPIQRRRRAKLILQSLGRDFGDVEPWIDLSQYPQNWPELSRNKYAAA